MQLLPLAAPTTSRYLLIIGGAYAVRAYAHSLGAWRIRIFPNRRVVAYAGRCRWKFMSTLLTADARDWHDAHGYPEADVVYAEALEKQKNCGGFSWTFELVDGFFKQSDDETDDMAFEYTKQDFGRKMTWEEIRSKVHELNAKSNENTCYKVLFLARHGQGWHNIASAKYLAQEWHDKWRFLGYDGEITWGPDPHLTELGVKQAQENRDAWGHQLQMNAPIPTVHFVSPLQRSCRTLEETWRGIEISPPIVSELVRETIGLHLCHKRSKKLEIQNRFPSFTFEDNFTEKDQLFDSFQRREEYYEQFLRANRFLQNLFDTFKDEYVSITSHAGMIRAFITVVGHRKFTVPTGGMVPVVVKGTRS